MMCHQYVYAEAIPKECKPIISSVKKPFKEYWNWSGDKTSVDHDHDDDHDDHDDYFVYWN